MNDTPVGTRGVALLLMMLLLLGGSAFAMLQSARHHNTVWQATQESGQALAAAKTALIAFAVNYADNYGHNTRGGTGRLPCPADERYSRPRLSCQPNVAGFLPALWERDGKLMDIDYLERFLDRDLWYVVADDFRYNPSFNSLNPDSASGLLSVDNRTDVVAVIIDPGPALESQAGLRPSTQSQAYLEGENADGDNHFSVSQLNSNDRLVWITRDELMPLVERRVLGIVSDWLREYKQEHGSYPYASALGDQDGNCLEGLTQGWLSLLPGNCTGPSFGAFVSASVPANRAIVQTWFARNRWANFIVYTVEENCIGSLALSRCDGISDQPHSLRLDDVPSDVLLISAGTAISTALHSAGQDRSLAPASLDQYLDTAALLEAHPAYPVVRRSPESNDQFLAITQGPVL